MPPTQVLDKRLQLVGHHVVPCVLVQREPCPTHWATWEPSASVSSLVPVMQDSLASRGRAGA